MLPIKKCARKRIYCLHRNTRRCIKGNIQRNGRPRVGKVSYVTRQRFEHFASSLIDLDTLIDWISENLDPEEAFSVSQLAAWADANGFELVP